MFPALILAFLSLAPPDDLLTVAEKSDFKATARYADVVELCAKLAGSSPLIRLAELGKSAEGRSLPLMIVADPPVATPEQARASGKVVVFLFGNIHAGEVCGKEALPILVREVVEKPGHPLLKHLVLLVAPIYNADGNERVAKANRPGQVGPEEGMGQRANAKGLDLNRDFMKLEAPETRSLVKLLNAWDPALVVDTHTTNGSHHRYSVTYDGPKNPAGNGGVIAFARDRMFPEVGTAFEKQSGLKSYWYGNFEDHHTRWTSFPATPRFGTTYIGLRNRLSVLSEAYSYAPYKTRVEATRDFCYACLEFASVRRDEVRALLADARKATVAAGRDPKPDDLVPIRTRAGAWPAKASVLGFVEVEKDGREVATDEPKAYECSIERDFVATVAVPRPFGYLIPPGHDKAVGVLKDHGIEVETLTQKSRFAIEAERIDAVTRSRRPFEGHSIAEVVGFATRAEGRTFPAGTALIRTSQPLGTLAVYLLEARSEDGLAAWNYFDEELGNGREFPVLRVPKGY